MNVEGINIRYMSGNYLFIIHDIDYKTSIVDYALDCFVACVYELKRE